MVWREGQEPSPFPARPTRENVRRYADYREHRPDYRSDYRSNSNYKRLGRAVGCPCGLLFVIRDSCALVEKTQPAKKKDQVSVTFHIPSSCPSPSVMKFWPP